MTKALGIGGNERSNFILVQSPDEDGNYSTSKEIQQGKQVSYNAVNPDDLLKEKKNPEPIVWLLGLVISYFFTRNISEKNPEAHYYQIGHFWQGEDSRDEINSTSGACG